MFKLFKERVFSILFLSTLFLMFCFSEKAFWDEYQEEVIAQDFNNKTYGYNNEIYIDRVLSEIYHHYGNQPINVIPRDSTSVVYDYIDSIKNRILNKSKIRYKEDFEWKIIILGKDQEERTKSRGNYIYFDLNLLSKLESIDELFALLAREIAQVDLRHAYYRHYRFFDKKVKNSLSIIYDFIKHAEKAEDTKYLEGLIL